MQAIDYLVIGFIVVVPIVFMVSKAMARNDISEQEDRRRLECMREHAAWKDVAKRRVS